MLVFVKQIFKLFTKRFGRRIKENLTLDELVKSRKPVIPAKAGIQNILK